MLRYFKTGPPQTKLPVLMSDKQRTKFQAQLKQAKGYFEWGCGGSTLLADATPSLVHVSSVESDFEWAKKVSDLAPNSNIIWIDIGATKEFGYPVEENLKAAWPRYSDIWNQTELPYDLVMIDGRFRVACCLSVLMNPKKVQWILFDDFKYRPEYHVILPFVDKADFMDSMLICKPKRDINQEKLQELYQLYKCNPA
jgi:protein O-GlcNAc transferase